VIKTIVGENIPAGIQIRLELEADILRRIRHPLMAPLLSVGRQDGTFFWSLRIKRASICGRCCARGGSNCRTC
jgi:hypothetical protein